MATYTVAELKDQSSSIAVNSYSDAKVLRFQTLAEATLTAFQLDTSMTGYQDAYDSAVLYLFDYYVENPAGFTKITRGKVSKDFAGDLLAQTGLGLLLQPYIDGTDGTLTPAIIERKDVGLR